MKTQRKDEGCILFPQYNRCQSVHRNPAPSPFFPILRLSLTMIIPQLNKNQSEGDWAVKWKVPGSSPGADKTWVVFW